LLLIIIAPETFQTILSLLLSTVRGEHKEAITVYATDEQEWKDFLFKMVPEDQLRVQFSGNKANENT